MWVLFYVWQATGFAPFENVAVCPMTSELFFGNFRNFERIYETEYEDLSSGKLVSLPRKA